MPCERAVASGAIALATALASTRVRADLPASGERIRTHDYAIDLSQTAVLSSTRVTGLSGAFVAIGEGVDGTAQNPAAAAFRFPWSRDHFDYDLGFGFMRSSALSNSDFFNSGRRIQARNEDESFLFLSVAIGLQFGNWGFAVSSDLQSYGVNRSGVAEAPSERLVADFAISHLLAAYAFADGQLLIGVGQRSGALDVGKESDGADQALFSALGAGYEGGILIRPNQQRFRIGAAVRSTVEAEASASSRVRVLYPDEPDNALYLPDRVTLPWNVSVGFALQLGPRPLNPRFIDPHDELEELERFLSYREGERERRRDRELARTAGEPELEARRRALDAELGTEAALDAVHRKRARAELDRKLKSRYLALERRHLLITTSLEVLGAVDDAVGVESFLERRVQRAGRKVSVSPRLGLETEPIAHWLRVRAGTYLEPTRFDDNPNGTRLHGTLGLDQRIVDWSVFGLFPEGSIFRATGSLDIAERYFTWGAAVGLWH